MPPLPPKIYLSRKDVLGVVGGRTQLERLEAEKKLRRHFLQGYTRARYMHAEVKRVLDDLRGVSS